MFEEVMMARENDNYIRKEKKKNSDLNDFEIQLMFAVVVFNFAHDSGLQPCLRTCLLLRKGD